MNWGLEVLSSTRFRSVFNLTFTRSKLTSPSICLVWNRVLWFQEFAQNSAASAVHFERARERERAQRRTHQPPNSAWPRTRTRTDWNPDWCNAGLQTTAPPDFCTLRGVCNTVKPSRRRGSWQGGAAGRFLTKICQNWYQNVIFDIISDIHKD